MKLNCALGLTRLPFLPYGLATLVCMIAGAAAYAWLGHAGRSAIAGEADAVSYALLGLAVIALIALTPRVVRSVKTSPAGWITVPDLRDQPEIGTHISTLSRSAGGDVLQNRKRSAQAAALLREEGIERVRVLRGGMEAWIEPRNPD